MKEPGRNRGHRSGWSKCTRALAERADNAAEGEVLDVVVELQVRQVEPTPGATREGRIEGVRQGFERDAAAVEAAIRSAGGTVTAQAWINQTIRASVPVEALAVVAELDEVVTLDVPRVMRPE